MCNISYTPIFYECVQITLSDLPWVPLVEKDSKYHRPKSNDIFYRRHRNNKKLKEVM